MKQLYKVLALALALVVLMTGCSASTAGYAKKKAATYGTETTYMDEANFWLRYYQWSYESYYGVMYQYYYGYDNMWILDSGNHGQTFAEYIKETAMAEILQTYIILDHAKGEVTLTEAEQKHVADAVASIRDGFADEFFKLAGIADGAEGDAQMTKYLTTRSKAVKVANEAKQALDVEISDRSNYEAFTVSYILIPEDKEGEETETSAEQLAIRMRMALEGGKSMDELKETYSDLSQSTLSFAKNNTTSESAIYQNGVTMKTGEAKVAHVDGTGYYVLYCDDDDDEAATQEKIDAAVETARTEKFTEVYKEWAKDAKTFKVAKAFTRLKVEPAYVEKASN